MQEPAFKQKDFPFSPFSSFCIRKGKNLLLNLLFIVLFFCYLKFWNTRIFFHNHKTLWLRHILGFLTSLIHLLSQGVKNQTNFIIWSTYPDCLGRERGIRKERSREEVDIVTNQHLNNYYHHIAHNMCWTLGEISMVSLNLPNNLWRSKALSHFTDEETAQKWQR